MTAPATEPIEVARRANELFASVPFEQLREIIVGAETYEEALDGLEANGAGGSAEWIDPEVEIEIGAFEGASALAGGGGRGPEAWLRFWQEWLEPWEDLVFEAVSYEDAPGDHVLVDAIVTARGRLGGVPVELSVCQLWGVRDGRVVRYAVHPTRELALATIDDDGGEGS